MAAPDWYPDPSLPGQLRYWDGSAWTPHTSRAVAAQHRSGGATGRRTVVIVVGACVAALAVVAVLLRLTGFTATVTSVHTGDTNVAEFTYSQDLRTDVAAIETAARGLHPACDKGGQLQACYSADLTMISTLNRVRDRLAAMTAPTRYAQLHGRLLASLYADAAGFALRNRAIEEHSNTEWQQANSAIEKAATSYAVILGQYPRGTVLADG